jgi:hypothetical protein
MVSMMCFSCLRGGGRVRCCVSVSTSDRKGIFWGILRFSYDIRVLDHAPMSHFIQMFGPGAEAELLTPPINIWLHRLIRRSHPFSLAFLFSFAFRLSFW